MYATYEASSAFGEGDGALLAGTLRQEGGCVIVETEDGASVLPIFPAGTTGWDGASKVLTLNGTDYLLGSAVSFGGGYTDRASIGSGVPEACDGQEDAFIVTSAGSAD